MPVNQDQFAVTPYTSTVPLVQIPPDVMSGQTRPDAPLQGQFGKKGTGALAIGDSLLKGFMLGHQQKEQRKQAQAQATINAADAASEAAYQEYQTALTNAGGKADDPKAQAAYQAYTTAFQAGKQAKAQFVIPDKTQKGKKNTTDTDPVKSPDDKKKKGAASAGFNSIKDFFEANPHIVPQIALMTMQPKPPGLSPQAQTQSLELQDAQRRDREGQRIEQAQKIYDTGSPTFSSITDPETLPPASKKDYDTWVAAKNILYPMKETGKDRVWTNGKDFISLTPGQAPPSGSGYYPYEKGPTQGSDAEEENKYLKEKFGVTRDKATTEQLAAATQYARAAKIPQTKTDNISETTPQGVHKSTMTRTAIVPPPTAGAAPTGQGAQGIGRPPQAGKAAKTGSKAGIVPPPGGKQTALTAQVTRQAVHNQQEGYRKTEAAYTKAIADADKAFVAAQAKATQTGDPSILTTAQAARDRAYARATLDREEVKASVAEEYDAAVRSIGGTPGSQSTADNPPPGATARVKDANGKLIGYAVNGQFVPLGK